MIAPPPDRLPVLTEVVALPPPPAVDAHGCAPDAAPAGDEAAPGEAVADAELLERVIGNVQRQMEAVLEQRLREAIGPALARLADALVQEARGELASTLRDAVSRAVAQELSRHRER